MGLGTITPEGLLHINGGDYGGNAAFVLNQTGATTNDIFAASSSGVTKFVIKNDGTASSSAGFTIDGVGNIQSTLGQTLSLGGGTSGNLVIGQTGKDILFGSSTFANCTALETSGGVLSCGSDAGGSAENYWQYNAATGIVANGNLTTDLLLGGTSTSSARAAFLNIAGGTPTASLSAGINGGAYLTAAGTLQTTANQTLTLGGNTTGEVAIGSTNNFLAAQTTGKIGFGGPVSTSDYLANITADSTQNWSRVLNITQSNNTNEDSSVIAIANTASPGTVSGTKNIYNFNATLTPTATVNNSGTLSLYGSSNTIDLSNTTLSGGTGADKIIGARGSYVNITGTPVINTTTETLLSPIGVHSTVGVTPTLTAVGTTTSPPLLDLSITTQFLQAMPILLLTVMVSLHLQMVI